MIGSSVGPYRILQKLGEGGMGEVYLAEDSRLRRKVALKSLSPRWANSVEARKGLLREARLAAGLNHPNIAAVYDVIEVQETAHIVMEYLEGETLGQRLRRERIPPEQVVEIALQFCDALVEAHRIGIVHRDLKPANIYLTHAGVVKVLDFGLSKMLRIRPPGPDDTTDSGLFGSTESGTFAGTPAYMAPEQLTGQALDTRSDVYSMGVVLFEMLSGRAPFHAREIMQLGLAILTKPAPQLIHVDRSVPAGLSEIVGKALEKEPSRRFQSASELRHALLSGARPLRFPADSAADSAPAPARMEPQTRPAPYGVVIAVLPLTTPSNDPQCEYMAAGIAEVLISNIGGIPDVTVISRYATLEYREAPRDLQKIARNLGASLFVEGSLQREQDRIRVVLNVISAGANTVHWSRRFDGTASEMFALQSMVTEAVLSALQNIAGESPQQLPARLPTTNPEAFADYSQALALRERPDIPGNLERAEELFLAAILKDPRFTLAHAGLGELYWTKFQQRKESAWTTKAMECLMEALRIDPKQPLVREVLATIYRGTGRLAAAAEELRQTLALQPNNDEAHCLLAQVLAESGNVDEAIGEMNEAIALRPHYALHHMRLGRVCYSAGRYPGAIAAFARATELQSDNAWPFQMLGTAYHSSGDAGRALENYEKSVSLMPTANAYTNIGMIYYSQNRFEEALSAYENAVRLSPNNPVHHRNAGDTLLRMGQTERAQDSYRRAVQLTEDLLKVNPNSAELLSRLAVYDAKLGRFEEALRRASLAFELNPADVSVIYRKAAVHARAGQAEPALQFLKQALDKGYSRALVLDDDDFGELRDSTEFTSLVGQ